jgi:hypothetical protein
VAVRDRPAGLRGPLRSWVTWAEARQLTEELGAVETTDDLEQWAVGSPLAPPRGFTAGRYTPRVLNARTEGVAVPLSRGELEAALAAAVLELAARRRHEAVVEHAREHGMSVAAAVGADGLGRSLGRCPTCDAPVELTLPPSRFYCAAHVEDERAEVAELLGLRA